MSTEKYESEINTIEQLDDKIDKFLEKYVFNEEIEEIINLSNLKNPLEENFQDSLDQYLIWQNEAKEKISSMLASSLIQTNKKKWPLWVLFFHWPTWVWKTESVKALAKVLFWDENWFIKVACEDYQTSHKAEKFTWSPPGYISYEDWGIFNSKTFYSAYDTSLKNNKLNANIKKIGPINIVLFDEIEKAHSNVLQAMLWILWDWKLILWNPTKLPIDFWNTIIIMTSNIWEHELSNKQSEKVLWFDTSNNWENIEKDRKTIFNNSLKDKFTPEWLGRIDSFIEFKQLNKDELIQLIKLNIKEYIEIFNWYYINYPDINIILDKSIYDNIIENWYNNEKWARDLVRGYKNLVEWKLDLLVNNFFKKFYNLAWIINLYLFQEESDIKVKLQFKSSWKNINKFLPSIEVKYPESNYISVINWDIVDLENIIYSVWIWNISDISTYYKWNTIYILNNKVYFDRVNSLNDIIWSPVNLNLPILESLWFKANNIETLINKLIENIGKENSRLEQLIIFQLYISFEKICLITWISMPLLLEELIPIIIRTIEKIKK